MNCVESTGLSTPEVLKNNLDKYPSGRYWIVEEPDAILRPLLSLSSVHPRYLQWGNRTDCTCGWYRENNIYCKNTCLFFLCRSCFLDKFN